MAKQTKTEIFLLGEFKILVNGEDIIEPIRHSPKKIMLLEYLLINNNRLIPVNNLVEALWGGKDDYDLKNTLRTLVSRLRKDLSAYGLGDCVVTKRGTYMWNPDLSCTIDVFHVENLCAKADELTSLDEKSIAIFEEILYLYRDDLLANSSLSTFLAPKVYYYHNLYLKTIYKYIDLLNKESKYTDIIRVCKTALEIDLFDTTINLELMRALFNNGETKKALTQYHNVTELHFNHMGVKPDDEIIEFYKVLTSADKSVSSNIEDIHIELQSLNSDDGALICEYSIFKDIYKLYNRNLRRLNIKMFLCIVSLEYTGVEEADPFEQDKAMTSLRDILKENLRTGDTISRCSPSQFALLLPTIEAYEMGRMVLKRVQSLYYSKAENSMFKMNFSLLELKE